MYDISPHDSTKFPGELSQQPLLAAGVALTENATGLQAWSVLREVVLRKPRYLAAQNAQSITGYCVLDACSIIKSGFIVPQSWPKEFAVTCDASTSHEQAER